VINPLTDSLDRLGAIPNGCACAPPLDNKKGQSGLSRPTRKVASTGTTPWNSPSIKSRARGDPAGVPGVGQSWPTKGGQEPWPREEPSQLLPSATEGISWQILTGSRAWHVGRATKLQILPWICLLAPARLCRSPPPVQGCTWSMTQHDKEDVGLLCMRGRRWHGRVPLVSSLRATSPLVYKVVAFSPHVMPSFPTLAKPLQSCWLLSVSYPRSVPDALTSPLSRRSAADQWRSSTEASPVLGAATTYVAPSFVPHFSLVGSFILPFSMIGKARRRR
jgi:hypothetical protein